MVGKLFGDIPNPGKRRLIICANPACLRVAPHAAKGYCKRCYETMGRTKKATKARVHPKEFKRDTPLCTACGKQPRVGQRSMCQACYYTLKVKPARDALYKEVRRIEYKQKDMTARRKSNGTANRWEKEGRNEPRSCIKPRV